MIKNNIRLQVDENLGFITLDNVNKKQKWYEVSITKQTHPEMYEKLVRLYKNIEEK